MIAALCALFFLSGAAGLVFETLWFRQAGLAFGNGVWASSLVLASFMAGLAIGNALAARFGARVTRPVRGYAILELGVAISGVALVFLLPQLTPGLAVLLREVGPASAQLLRLGFGFALLLIPATAMGATLPLLVNALRARDPSFGGALGRLYGWNTLGAVAGTLLAEWWLLERFGVRGSAAAAACANVLAAAGGVWLARGGAFRFTPPVEAGGRLHSPALRLLLAAAASGAILLALEVVWFRFLRLFVHSGSAAFACMLGVVLAGIGVGGAGGGAWLRRSPTAWRRVPGLAAWAGAATAALYAGFGWTTAGLGAVGQSDPVWVIARAAALALPVALLSGALFPLLGAALAREVSPEVRAAGLLTLWNTLGAGLGSLIGGFVLLPWLGVESSIFALAIAYAGVALCASPLESELSRASRWLPRLALLLAAIAFPFGAFDRDHLRVPVAKWHRGTDHEIAAVREGRSETAVLVLRRLAGEPLHHFLMTDSYAMSGTSTFSRRYMKLFVYAPVALRPEPRSALLISYGVGSTARALVDTKSLESIDVVDISREILGLADVVFPDPDENPLRDPRVRVHVEDGRHFLQLNEDRYDLITAEPPPPKNAGVVNLYTREYFGLMRERLHEGGMASYWLPVHNLTVPDAKAIIRAFCDPFPDCSLWVGHDLNWMLLGSRGRDGPPADLAGVTSQWRDPEVLSELRRLGLGTPATLAATFLGDASWLAELTRDTPPLTDDFPKRLSSRLQRRAYPDFLPWLDPDEARERFRDSEFITSAWPPELREPSLEAFSSQGDVNRIGRREPLAFAERLASVDRLLSEGHPTLALWRLGIVRGELDAIEAALAKGAPEAPHQRTLAAGSLVEGAFDDAAGRFARARLAAPQDAGLLYLEIYARCRADDADAAASLAGRELPRYARDPEVARVRRWLAERCGWAAERKLRSGTLADPRAES